MAISNGVCPSLVLIIVDVFASNSLSNVSLSPRLAHTCIGAKLSLPVILLFAPNASNSSTVSACPLRHAANSGVSPSAFFQSTWAPISSKDYVEI